MVASESNQQQPQSSSRLKPSYVPKTLTNLLNELAKIDNVEKKISVLNDYLKKYEEELSQVEDLRRDLPQCMLLLTDAIEIIKDEITKTTTKKVAYGDQDISVLYDHNHRIDAHELQRRFSEFLRSKKGTYENECRDDEMSNTIYKNNVSQNKHISTQTGFVPWIPYQDHLHTSTTHEWHNRGKGIMEMDNKGKNEDDKDDENEWMMSINYRRMAAKREKKNGKRGGSVGGGGEKVGKMKRSGSVVNEMNEMIDGGGVLLNQNKYGGGSGLQLQAEQALFFDATWKSTTRRTWTPHLHQRFVQALNVLGGPQVATPKQIKEQMNVRDLTNDQVKSHLQKYRLHLREFPPIPTNTPTTNQINGSDYKPELPPKRFPPTPINTPTTNQINDSDYQPQLHLIGFPPTQITDYEPALATASTTASYNQAFNGTMTNDWFTSSSAEPQDANISGGVAGTSGGATSATTVENDGSEVVNGDEPGHMSFRGWFTSSDDRSVNK